MNFEYLPGRLLRAFYRGDGRIARFRTSLVHVADEDLCSEDWIGAVVSPFGGHVDQRAVLSGGRTLREAVEEDPVYWLGPGRTAADWRFVPLVKLLDTGDRIPVHVHPDDLFAQSVLGMANGKSENWIVLQAEEDSEVFIGWKETISRDTLEELVRAQNIPGLLDRMHRFQAKVGDSIFVPAGVPHSIGSGMLINEVQQSADASLLLEHVGYTSGSEGDSFVGLPLEVALNMTNLDGCERHDIEAYRRQDVYSAAGSMIVPDAEPFFSALLAVGDMSVAAGFRIGVVVDGSGTLRSDELGEQQIQCGDAFVVPHAAGEILLAGPVKVACFGLPARFSDTPDPASSIGKSA